MADRLTELAARACAGALTEEEEQELLCLVKGTPEARRVFAEQLLAHRLLAQVARPAIDPARVLAALPRGGQPAADAVMRSVGEIAAATKKPRPLWARAGALAAAAVVLVLSGYALRSARYDGAREAERAVAARSAGGTPPRFVPAAAPPAAAAAPPPFTVRAVAGAVLLATNDGPAPLTAGRALHPGALLTTVEKSGSVSLSTTGGAELRIDGPAVVHVPGTVIDGSVAPSAGGADPAALVIARGRIALLLPTGAPALALATPHARFALDGGRARVAVTDAETRADIVEGRGRLRGRKTGRAVELGRGQYALVSDDGAASTRPESRPPLALFLAEKGDRGADALLRARLERLGFVVKTGGADLVRDDVLGEAALVVVSSTFNSLDMLPVLREVAAPMVVCEPMLFDDLGMTDGPESSAERYSYRAEIDVVDTDNPLAAKLSGAVRVATRPINVGYGRPSPRANRVAALSGGEDWAVFAYDRGTMMPGGVAPGRRVSCFLRNDTASHLTTAGWALFDAAVTWAVEKR